jgi:hypothetical protein
MPKLVMSIVLVIFLLSAAACGDSKSMVTNPSTSTTVLNSTTSIISASEEPLTGIQVISNPPPGPEDFPLEVTGSPETVICLPGQTVKITLSFTNLSSYNTITIKPFPSDLRIDLQANLSDKDREIRIFPVGTQEVNLQPGQVITQTFSWNQLDDNGKQVLPGWYILTANVTYSRGDVPIGQGFGNIAKILIQYPQGAMEKTIDSSLSQTSDGITITLQKVELTSNGASIYAFYTPRGYVLDNSSAAGPSNQQFWVMPNAEYNCDNVLKQAGPSGIHFYDTGIQLIWDQLDPIPQNAKTIQFSITQLGNRTGPWVFNIQLQ